MFTLLSFSCRPFLSNKPIDFAESPYWRKESEAKTNQTHIVMHQFLRKPNEPIRFGCNHTKRHFSLLCGLYTYRAFLWQMRAQMVNTHWICARMCHYSIRCPCPCAHAVFLDNELCCACTSITTLVIADRFFALATRCLRYFTLIFSVSVNGYIG